MYVFLAPTLAPLGPAAGQVMAGLAKRRLMTILPIAAILTLLPGLRLMWIASAGFSSAYFATPVGQTYSAAGGLAIVAFVVGMAVSRPAAMRAGAIGAQMASAPDDAARSRLAAEMEGARRRGTIGGMIVLILLTLASAGMATARYLG